MVTGNPRRAHAILTGRLIVLALGAVVLMIPFAYMVATSFKPNAVVLEIPPQIIPHHPTTANYTDAWTSNRFGRYFLNSVLVAVATTFAAVLLSSMMAYSFARFRFFGRRVLFGLLLIGLMVPGMMLLIPQFLLAKQLTLLNSLWGLVFFYTAGNLALQHVPAAELLPGHPVGARGGDGRRRRRAVDALLAADPAALAARPRDRLHLHVPRELGRIHLGVDDDQRPEQVHASDRDRALPGRALDQPGVSFSPLRRSPSSRRSPIFVAFQRQFISGLSSGALKA